MTAYIKISSEKRVEITEIRVKELWWQKRGLFFTATGYGNKIPSIYMLKYQGRWYRIYIRIYSNSGTSYIVSKGTELIVDLYQ